MVPPAEVCKNSAYVLIYRQRAPTVELAPALPDPELQAAEAARAFENALDELD